MKSNGASDVNITGTMPSSAKSQQYFLLIARPVQQSSDYTFAFHALESNTLKSFHFQLLDCVPS